MRSIDPPLVPPRKHRLAGAAAFAAGLAAWLYAAAPAAAQTPPYKDPSQPVATRVNDLLSRMTLDEKLGQMTQAERGSISSAQITQFRIGSVLSGGGSAPSPHTATRRAGM